MNHPLFVGHFDTNVRSFRPKTTKSVDLSLVRTALLGFCDKEKDGTPVVNPADLGGSDEVQWLGRIDGEDVLCKGGYLVFPWLGCALNERSVEFVLAIHRDLGVDIFDPGDAVFYTEDGLREAGKKFRAALRATSEEVA